MKRVTRSKIGRWVKHHFTLPVLMNVPVFLPLPDPYRKEYAAWKVKNFALIFDPSDTMGKFIFSENKQCTRYHDMDDLIEHIRYFIDRNTEYLSNEFKEGFKHI